MINRPIFDMAAVMQFVRDAGPDGIDLEDLRQFSSGGISIDSGLRHLREVGAVCKVGPGERFAATPDQRIPPKELPPKLEM